MKHELDKTLLEGVDKAISGLNKMSHLNEKTLMLGNSESGSTELVGLKRCYVRDKGSTHIDDYKPISNFIGKPKSSSVVGWFYNKYNSSGFIVCRLDSHDRQFLGSHAKGAFRVFTEKGTSIVTFNLEKGTYAFLDNAHYEETDKLRFEKKSAFTKFFVDNKDLLKKDFGFDVQI